MALLTSCGWVPVMHLMLSLSTNPVTPVAPWVCPGGDDSPGVCARGRARVGPTGGLFAPNGVLPDQWGRRLRADTVLDAWSWQPWPPAEVGRAPGQHLNREVS